MPSVWSTLEALERCLCEEFADDALCFCGVQAGDQALIEYVSSKGAMVWVRLDNSFASSNFPDPDAVLGCGTSLAHVIEVGAMQCFPIGKQAPAVEQYREGAQWLAEAAERMAQTIVCCLNDADLQYVLGQFQPYGPQGGVLGGMWQVTVEAEWL